MIKVREVEIAIKVKRSDAGDVSPVAMFLFRIGSILWNYSSIDRASVISMENIFY